MRDARRLLPLLALVALTGCSGSHRERAYTGGIALETTVASHISGGNPAQRSLARRILRRMGLTDITRIEIVPSPPRGRAWHERRDSVDLDIHSAQPSIRSQWLGEAFAATFVAAAQRTRFPPVAAVGIDDAGFGVPFHWSALDRARRPTSRSGGAAYLGRLARVARSAHARVVEQRLLWPGPVVAMTTLQMDDPAAFLRHRSDPVIAAYETWKGPVLGAFLGLEDRSGRLVWGLAQFPGEGSYFVVPALDECDKIETLGRPGPAPPRCPVH